MKQGKISDYVNPIPIKITDDKAIFKVEKLVPTPYIERVLPLEYAPLYEQLAQLDTAIPKIVCLEKSDRLTVVEEYITSPRLDQYLENHQLTSTEIHDLICQLLDVLEVLHKQTPLIIHRDIKPENIFYDGQKLILADFDIARNTQEEADRDTHILGSLGYAAPEQFGFSQSGPASDFYAVGVLMNVLYTGSLPSVNLYQGPERAIIEKATHINSQKRYQSAQEFKDAITDLGRSSWRLPGFRSHQPARMLMATCGYLLMLFSSFNMEAKGNSAVDRFLLRLSFFMILFMIVLFACNYRNIKDTCLFHSSKSKFVRFCGIIISYLLVATVLTTALAALSVAISSFGL
ncbi:serine/threonine protein kinase [Lactobacillus porci]|uniref:non-specific serine/threonine protein kinase n=1 Tax=Lactobacillus porci TaxID=2012477 RepID=A0A6A8MFL0_9LACO|nr:protein kinase [Lactobacillus porci]MST87608.1 protein kinase [Lactobacillus porci]